MKKNSNKFIFKPIVSITAIFSIIICIGILKYNFVEKKDNTSPHISNSTESVYVSKIDLPNNTNATMDMIGLVMYQGRIYTQTGTKISPENAETLIGEKLGTTKGNIDEWSKQSDYAIEFASTIGKSAVYSVKGYDKNFRIMTFEKINGTAYAEFYECFNGIIVKSGADIFNKLKMENNIKIAKYENFKSWNYNNQEYKKLTNLNAVNNLVNELKNTIPYTQESLSYLWDDKEGTNRKFVYVTLNDGSEVHLNLFKDGYVYYNCSHIFFKMHNDIFNNLWNELN